MFAEESPDWNLDLDGSVTCELCGEEPATMHLLRVVDGAVSHTHLCPGCAEGVAEQTERPGLGAGRAVGAAPPGQEGRGRRHGSPLSVRRRRAVLRRVRHHPHRPQGVGDGGLRQVLPGLRRAPAGVARRRAREPVEHLGKMPQRGPETDVLRHEIMRLQRMLRELVECERFEEAAGVRDRLTELGQRLEGEPS